MFTRTQLKDLELMVERYRAEAEEGTRNAVVTEGIKRALAREMIRADELLAAIRENVSASDAARDEPESVPASCYVR